MSIDFYLAGKLIGMQSDRDRRQIIAANSQLEIRFLGEACREAVKEA